MGIRPADFLPGRLASSLFFSGRGPFAKVPDRRFPNGGGIAVGKNMIIIGSVTYAMKGQKLLAHYGIRSSVERIYRSTGGNGCGYGLLVPSRTDEAEQMLRQGGIPVAERIEWEA